MRMLLAVLNKSRKQHPTKRQLYENLSPITQTIPVTHAVLSEATFLNGLPFMNAPVLANQQNLTIISSMRTLDTEDWFWVMASGIQGNPCCQYALMVIMVIIQAENIQSGHRDGIWPWKMRHAGNEKQETTHGRRNGTTKSTKYNNARRKRNPQIFGNTGRWHCKTSRDERKKN